VPIRYDTYIEGSGPALHEFTTLDGSAPLIYEAFYFKVPDSYGACQYPTEDGTVFIDLDLSANLYLTQIGREKFVKPTIKIVIEKQPTDGVNCGSAYESSFDNWWYTIFTFTESGKATQDGTGIKLNIVQDGAVFATRDYNGAIKGMPTDETGPPTETAQFQLIHTPGAP